MVPAFLTGSERETILQRHRILLEIQEEMNAPRLRVVIHAMLDPVVDLEDVHPPPAARRCLP